jgi:hypothetical protein
LTVEVMPANRCLANFKLRSQTNTNKCNVAMT